MSVQFWPSVSFTYYNDPLAYANHKPEPSPGTSKRSWMMLHRFWLVLAVRLSLQAFLSVGRTAESGLTTSRGFLRQSMLQDGKGYFWGPLINGNPLWSLNHRTIRVQRDLIDHLVPTPLPRAGTPSTRPGCSKPHPTWPWTLPGRGHPQLLWATCSSASPPSE